MASVDITDNTNEFKKELANAVPAILEAIGIHIEGEAKDELENDPRRIDTGNLRNSITHAVEESEEAVYVGTNVEYAPYVHEGTQRMAPNRFLVNAVERNQDQIKKYMEDGLKNA